METALSFHNQKKKYNDHNIFVVYWWGRYSYLNNEPIKISDILLMNYAFVSSGSFGLRFRSKCIGNNTYTFKRRKLCSKTTPIYEPFHK